MIRIHYKGELTEVSFEPQSIDMTSYVLEEMGYINHSYEEHRSKRTLKATA